MSLDEDKRRTVFTCIHHNGDKVRHTTYAVGLAEVINAFEEFLRGCGYSLGGGHLTIEYPEEADENPDR